MSEDKNIWSSNYGDIEISEMSTNHIRNTLKHINHRINTGVDDDYPIQYEVLFDELASRDEDTDFELDEIYKGLDEDEDE